jgi:cell division septation protein DedD
MSLDFSLDGKKVLLVSMISVILAAMIFVAGWMAGIMANISRMPSPEVGPSGPRGAAVSTPAGTPAPVQQKPAEAKQKIETDLAAQKPETTDSSQEAAGGEDTAPKVRMPIVPKPQTQNAQSVVEQAADKAEGAPSEDKAFSVQAGAFLEKNNADDMISDLKEKGYQPYIFETMNSKNQPVYSVRIGDYADLQEASHAASGFKDKEKMPAIITAIDSVSAVEQKDVQRSTPSKNDMQTETVKEQQPAHGSLAKQKVFTIQVASCIVMQNAVKTANDLKKKGYEVFILKKQGTRGKTWYAVQIGEFKDRGEASRAASEFTEKEKVVAVVMPIAPYLLEERKGPDSFEKPPDEQSGDAGEEAQSGSGTKDAQSQVKTE